MHDSTINELIAGCCKKNRSSQEALYRNFFGYAMSIAMRYAHQRDEAIEILNDAFLKVFQHIQTFDTNRSFKSWLAKIIVNTAIDYLRKQKKIAFTEEISAGVELSIADSIVDKLSYNELLQLVQALPPSYRTVFNLYVMDGFQHQEIARMLSISEGTSKSNLFKAKKILKEKILNVASTPNEDGIGADISLFNNE
ncbi:RNA polymerase sigma-70 factor, ECF subfamily [Chitinophaga jiangningensis]|uniref:RNA polymerase sigma-70 factor, ECF subfamily n=1 Tax=Chitinophaga jiangningensis TaxID=1419482 RepID=A0A1M7EKE6_9BACT|nr:RNA polymerase sigma factor [Chitinophaga jiangningensis]SHL92200.1 RNA polymerase sigma-70 factor, ECF subfamily [Chitinophaga jiangningensis]